MISDSPVIGTQPIEFKRNCLFYIFIKNEWLDFDTKHLYENGVTFFASLLPQ